MKEFGSIFFFGQNDSYETSFGYKLWYIELSGVNIFVYLILTNAQDCKLKDYFHRFY